MTTAFAFRYASRVLLRGGQRTIVAALCVAFGVMALVALWLLSATLSEVVGQSPRLRNGGEIVVMQQTPTDRARLDSLRQEGTIGAYTGIAQVGLMTMQNTRSGQIYFVSRVQGVDPATFPVIGRVEMEAGTLAEAVAEPFSAAISRDLAQRFGLAVGDTIRLGGMGAVPQRFRVGGIISTTPDAMGATVYLGPVTLDRLEGVPVAHTFAVRTDAPERAHAAFEQAGWQAEIVPAEDASDDILRFLYLLQGAGLLGLVIGGIGVASTLRVLLASRLREVATLKAMGYRGGHLMLLFGMETAMLGLVGSVVGVAIGYALALGLGALFFSFMPFLVEIVPIPSVLLGGFAAGVATALVFGVSAMARAAAVRPATLLRDVPAPLTLRHQAGRAGLLAVLTVLFWLLCSLVMQSPLRGVLVLGVVAAGFVVFGGLLGILLWLVVHIPTPGLPLVRLARRTLAERPGEALFALIALFVGTYAVGISSAAYLNADAQRDARISNVSAYNLTAEGPREDLAATTAALAEAGATAQYPSLVAMGRMVGAEFSTAEVPITGRRAETADWNADLTHPWTGAPGSVVLQRGFEDDFVIGDSITVEVAGEMHRWRVAGFYEVRRDRGASSPQLLHGVLVPWETVAALPGATYKTVASIPFEKLAEASRRVGQVVPQSMVVTKREMDDFLHRIFLGLFRFALAVASLAFVAGVVLIANAVTLALVERRRTLGLYKSLGYGRRHLLAMLLAENGLLGLLAGAAGVGAVAFSVAVLARLSKTQAQNVTPGLALFIVGVSVLLTTGTATVAAWRTLGLRPLRILRMGA